MKFKSEIVPWLPELKSYLTDSSKKIGEIKKVLKSVDFSKLDYPTQARLTSLFDPRCEITEELFKREINLYFSLLESKNSPITIPIFSNYIDWIYSQDIGNLTDLTFDIISSRLLKTTATTLSEPINSFMSRLPEEYNKDIDKLSNSRISTLINILNETKSNHENMPQECRDFVKRMFKACAVKTEIADKNKQRFRGLFRENPRDFYALFNKAFAGVSAYGVWIDEPAKKLTFKNMVNYANFQEQVLKNTRYGLNYSTFASCANDLRLPALPEYDPSSSYFGMNYLKTPREYKDYAKKMGNLFVDMVKFELSEIAKKIDNGKLSESDFDEFAVTHKMADKIGNIQISADKNRVLRDYAYELVNMVHLDELTGQSFRDIFNENDYAPAKKEISQQSQVVPNQQYVSSMVELPDYEIAEENKNLSETAPQAVQEISEEDYYEEDIENYNKGKDAYLYDMTLQDRIINNCCLPEDMPELLDRYNELMRNNENDYYLSNAIDSLEARMNDDDYYDLDEHSEKENG